MLGVGVGRNISSFSLKETGRGSTKSPARGARGGGSRIFLHQDDGVLVPTFTTTYQRQHQPTERIILSHNATKTVYPELPNTSGIITGSRQRTAVAALLLRPVCESAVWSLAPRGRHTPSPPAVPPASG